MGLLVLFLTGCRKEEAKPEIPASSPASYMKDKAFRKGLKDRNAAQRKIIDARAPLVARMQEIVEATKARLGEKTLVDGRDLVLEELEKDPEWRELNEKVKAYNAQYEAGRRDLLNYTRERIAPKGKKGN